MIKKDLEGGVEANVRVTQKSNSYTTSPATSAFERELRPMTSFSLSAIISTLLDGFVGQVFVMGVEFELSNYLSCVLSFLPE